MTTLTVWQSADNHCDGTIPTQLGSLDKLVTLDLSGMRLTGTMISEFGSLQALQALSLGNNDIGGSIPTEIGGMEALPVPPPAR
jgi:Leucine-rich repeat (LRR) protein